jgi:hypothetical protein
MTVAVYKPRERAVLVINDDGTQALMIAQADVPDFIEAVADAFAVPVLAARLATPPFDYPEFNLWNAV